MEGNITAFSRFELDEFGSRGWFNLSTKIGLGSSLILTIKTPSQNGLINSYDPWHGLEWFRLFGEMIKNKNYDFV